MSVNTSGLKHLYEPVEAYDIDEESKEERAKISQNIETQRRSKIIRKSYLIFPFLVLLVLIVYTTRKVKITEDDDSEPVTDSTSTDDKTVDDYEASISQTDDVVVAEFLHGNNWLFDFDTKNGGLENVNSYDDENYAEDLAYLNERVTYWTSQLAEPEVADESGQKSKWNKNGGVSPWRTDDNEDRTIDQIYSYAAAPNIVMFVVDDWGANDIGYQSDYLSWTTPNTDKLAANGIKLGNYYSNEWCVPSRAALMTGRYALRFGMHAPDDSSITSMELPLTEVTLAEELKSAGYRTNIIGKWHLGWSTDSKTPYHRGFDYFYGFLGAKIDYWTKEFDNFLDLRENDSTVSDEDEISADLHTAYLYANKAEEVIENHSKNYPDQPMFLYYGSQLIHTSWSAPQSFIDRCGVEEGTATESVLTYCAMNLLIDEAIGNLTCALDKYKMSDNTVFILVSDNGGILSMDGNNAPFRGSKGSMLRGANNVPGFIMGPSSLIPTAMVGETYDGQIHVTDWLPTLMGLATGGAWKGGLTGATIDGVDVWNAITTNSESPHTEIVHYVDDTGSICIQYDNKKLLITSVGLLGPHSEAEQIFIGDTPDTNVCLFD